MSPVLTEYSQLREVGPAEKRKRRKPLIAKLYAAGTAPPKPTAKSRKNYSSSLQVLARVKKGKMPGKQGPNRDAMLAECLTVDQRDQLLNHKREVAKLIEVLPSAGEAAEAVHRRILSEKRALRKLRIKAKKMFKKRQTLKTNSTDI